MSVEVLHNETPEEARASLLLKMDDMEKKMAELRTAITMAENPFDIQVFGSLSSVLEGEEDVKIAAFLSMDYPLVGQVLGHICSLNPSIILGLAEMLTRNEDTSNALAYALQAIADTQGIDLAHDKFLENAEPEGNA